MTKYIYLIFLMMIFQPVLSQNIDLGNKIVSEKKGLKIILPKIDSMVECYYEPVIFSNYNALSPKNKSLEMLALYLNRKDLDKMISQNKVLEQDESFSISRGNTAVDRKYLALLYKATVQKMSQYADSFWGNSSLKEIERNADSLINGENTFNASGKFKLNTPVLVNNYKLNEDAYSISLLTLINFNSKESKISNYVYQVANFIHIKNRIYYLYYTISYLDNFRMNTVNARNDFQVYKFLNLNK